jgi:anaerobic magnesium-protoporphyrin IX monomethyl ester cyclase
LEKSQSTTTTSPRVLFINPPSIPYTHVMDALGNRELDIPQPISMPMGILYLSAVLERDIPGVRIVIADLARAIRDFAESADRHDTTFDEFVTDALTGLVPAEFEPDFIGISILFSTAHKSTGHIAEAARRRWPDAPIVVGGMHATNAVASLLEMPAISHVCRGEAESIISTLLRTVMAKGDCEAIPGVFGRTKLAKVTGKPCENAPTIDDLDQIPFPAWHLLPMEKYVHSLRSRARHVGDDADASREATVITTRGCPFSCTFCSSWTVHGRQMRFRSAANIVSEIEILNTRFGVNVIVPEDDLFTVKKSRILELCSSITERFGQTLQFQFPAGLSVATLDEDVIQAMADMGMKVANIAIESGSPYVQRHIIKKNCNVERARHVVKTCSDLGIITRAYFVVGFPGETVAHIRETFDYARTIASDWNVFMIAAPLVGSEMYQQMLDRGDIGSDYNWDSAFFQERRFDTAEVRAEDLKKMVYDANIRINFFDNYNIRSKKYGKAIDLFSNIIHTYRGHLAAHYCIGMVHKLMGNLDEWRASIEVCRGLLAGEEHKMAHQQMAQFPELFSDL